MKLYIDFETYCAQDIKWGLKKYFNHPSFEILCMAYSLEGFKVHLWTPDMPIPKILQNPNITIIAHNAIFEKYCLEHMGIFPKRFRCTMSVCSYKALPCSLKEIGVTLGLMETKDTAGTALINFFCKDKKVSMADPHHRRLPSKYPEKFKELCDYCVQDIVTLKELHAVLGDLPETEQKLWELTNSINERGIPIDTELISKISYIYEAYKVSLNEKLASMTDDKVTSLTEVAKIKTYLLDKYGFEVTSLDKETSQKYLDDPYTPAEVKEIINIRAEGSKTSLAKVTKIENSVVNGRLYDTLFYHGATTGRWAGRGAQLQNLPRGSLGDWDLSMDEAVGVAKHNTLPDIEYMTEGKTLSFLSSLIRGSIVGDPSLSVADYSAIEARGVAWLSGQEDMLEDFRVGAKIYEKQAAFTYKIPLEEVTPAQRFVGKVLVLACSYGMSAGKFREFCKSSGVELSPLECIEAVDSYRTKNDRIVKEWWAQYNAVKSAIIFKAPVRCGKVTWDIEGDFLRCKLPSGRYLHYYKPYMGKNDWGMDVPYIHVKKGAGGKFMSCSFRVTMVVENIVQAISRDIMAHSMLALEANNIPILMTIHDELICDTDKDITEIMCDLPDWAEGFPIGAEGWVGNRYKK